MAEPHAAETGRADARSERAAGGDGAGLATARGGPRRAGPEREAAWAAEHGEG